jgi:hypothetical protein
MPRSSHRSRSLAPLVLLGLLAASCGEDGGTTKPPPVLPGDTTPPAAVADLSTSSVTDASITLTWTAPGDDDTAGVASAYCLRYATVPLTEESWEGAEEVTSVSSPDTAGSDETVRVTGLSDRTDYFFALKTADEVPNWSGLSNLVTGATLAGPAPDGNWSALGTGTDAPVNALEVYQGELIIGGRFASVSDRAAANVARWDGWTWKPLGSGTDREVRCFAVYGGALVAAGYLQEAGEVPVRLIAGWNGEGWDSLGSGLVASGHSFVTEMAVFEDRLVVGGTLSMVAGYNMPCWDGNVWARFGTGAGTQIEAMTVHNGELIASGQFGSGIDHLVRWDSDAWVPLQSGLWQGIYDLLSYEGDLVVAGNFSRIGGVETRHVACWDGTEWHSLGTGLEGYAAYCLEILDGDLVVGGSFTAAGGVPVRNIARWNGRDWYPVGSGTDGRILDLAVWDGALIAAGDFFEAGGLVVNHIAQWDDQPMDPQPEANHSCGR